MPDQHDLVCRHKVLGHFFIKRCLFRNPVALEMSLFPMDVVVMEAERIVGKNCFFIHRKVSVEVLIHMRRVMVDHDHHAAGLGRFARHSSRTRLSEKLPKSRDFLNAEFMSVRVFENFPLCADDKDELIASMGLDLTDLADQFNGVCPTQSPREFSHEKACVEKIEIVSYLSAHPSAWHHAEGMTVSVCSLNTFSCS